MYQSNTTNLHTVNELIHHTLKYVSGRVDGNRYKLLFQDNLRPIYNPLLFYEDGFFEPIYDPMIVARNSTLLFSIEEVKVWDKCLTINLKSTF